MGARCRSGAGPQSEPQAPVRLAHGL